jgi:RHS repeat-associated protein
MLLKASRPALAEGSDSTTSGTAATTVVYDVPLSGTTAPAQMNATTVATWAQGEAPTDATAVFPADSVPSSSTGSDLTSSAYDRATVTYIDANGRTVNTAGPGGSITTTEYDTYGNEITELTAANRELALGGSADKLAELGLTDLSTADRARLLATVSEYSADGERPTDEYGPLHEVTLTKELTGSTAESTLAAGSVTPARAHTAYTYDGNRPGDAAVSGLVTSTVTGAAITGYATDADTTTTTTTTTYDWSTGQEKATEGGGDSAARVTTYDDAGRIAATRTTGSSGSDAGAVTYTYYSASATGTCGSVEWAGLLCRTAPAGTVSGTNPAELVTTVYTYDRWGHAATTTESANGVTRTTTVTADTAGRAVKAEITGGAGEKTPATEYTYAKDSGRLATQTSNSQTITYGYDTLGRRTKYADGTGNTTTTSYDVLGRAVKRSDSAPSTVAYAYDTRGLVRTVTDSVAGTFTAAYDADGVLATETLPGGYGLALTVDPAGHQTAKEYTAADGTTVLADAAEFTVAGRQAGHTQTDGSTTQTDYTYDSRDRLVGATDATSTGCVSRAYGLDSDSNRTSLKTTTDDCDSSTSDATSTSTSYTYDAADRIVGAGYVYDALGRTTTAGDSTLTYFTNDLVRSETVGSSRSLWSLDAAGRLAAESFQTQNAAGDWTAAGGVVQHYGCDCDSSAWTDTNGSVSRTVQDATGGLAATASATGAAVLQLANLHGDIAVQLPLDTTASVVTQHWDEYGVALDDAGAAATYGWLGAHQRGHSSASGMTLMGVRLYYSATGRFLQVDPVYGGSASAYDYVGANPVSYLDLDGRKRYCSGKLLEGPIFYMVVGNKVSAQHSDQIKYTNCTKKKRTVRADIAYAKDLKCKTVKVNKTVTWYWTHVDSVIPFYYRSIKKC